MRRSRVATLLATLLLAVPVARAQSLCLAFGDSVTYGIGDTRQPGGYPPRLETLLREADLEVTVENWGVPGDTSSLALSRVDQVLDRGGDCFLLMLGTNDIAEIAAGELSAETVIDNLTLLARKAALSGARPVLATVIPRVPDAKFDRQSLFTLDLNWRIRELAVSTGRELADPWHFFEPENNPDVFSTLYDNDPGDVVGHPDPAGYDLLAGIFGDVLLARDVVPPVMGAFQPGPTVRTIDPETEIHVTLYEPQPGAGISLPSTRLLLNGRPVAEPAATAGARRLRMAYGGDFGCKAVVTLESEDLAEDVNTLERTVGIYDIRGRRVIDGDLDFDCRVDAGDLVGLATRFGAAEGDPLYQRAFDIDRNGVIDSRDLDTLGGNFGKSS